MTLSEYINRKLPEYYPTMYLDGYTPAQILQAHRKSMIAGLMPSTDNQEIHITTELKVKK